MTTVDVVSRDDAGRLVRVVQIVLTEQELTVAAVSRRYFNLVRKPMRHPDTGAELSLRGDPIEYLENLHRVLNGRRLFATRPNEGTGDLDADERHMMVFRHPGAQPS